MSSSGPASIAQHRNCGFIRVTVCHQLSFSTVELCFFVYLFSCQLPFQSFLARESEG